MLDLESIVKAKGAAEPALTSVPNGAVPQHAHRSLVIGIVHGLTLVK